jgi:hypothetical protein
MQDDDEQVEFLLHRFRPIEPAPSLRRRVLEVASGDATTIGRASILLKFGWLAAAAMVVFSVILSWRTETLESEIRVHVVGESSAGNPPTPWGIVFGDAPPPNLGMGLESHETESNS